MAKLKYQLTSPVVMWLIVVIGAIALWFSVPPGRIFQQDLFGPIVFGLGLANWLWVSVLASRVHRKAVSSVGSIDELVTEGAYSVVRHPMYLADIVLVWCVFIWQSTNQVLSLAIWLSLVLVFWAYLEERMLEEKFLEDYRAYKTKVPMFIPGL